VVLAVEDNEHIVSFHQLQSVHDVRLVDVLEQEGFPQDFRDVRLVDVRVHLPGEVYCGLQRFLFR